MDSRAGIQISKRTFLQTLLILLALMLLAGGLTRLLPAGQYQRALVDGLERIDPDSFQTIPSPVYPVWRWFTAPVEVLFAEGSLTLIAVGVFVLMVASAFAVLDQTGVVRAMVAGIVRLAGGRKYLLLLAVSLFFMALGALFGLFEEVVPLVPVIVALSYSLGWDALTGLGMSILATNLGFSAALTNPFTVGIAQGLAGLPLFSGIGLRLVIFIVIYVIFALFLTGYARRIERDPQRSPVYREDQAARKRALARDAGLGQAPPHLGRALAWLGGCAALVGIALALTPFVPALGSLSLPLVGVLFFAGGIGAGLLSGAGRKTVGRALRDGLLGILPGLPLILMAVSVKHIVVQGAILDTMLHAASGPLQGMSPFAAALVLYGLALGIEVFIAAGSAKALLMMPILLPLADLAGVTRQTTVLAYCFGDGLSNLIYPTNAVLLICLGLTTVSYPKWLLWSLHLWVPVVLVSLGFTALAVAIGYGPF